MAARKKIIATLDLETDPFKHGRVPLPFACGLYDGQTYWQTWGDDCVAQMIEKLRDRPPMLIYAHNGGRFDWWYFSHVINAPLTFIGSRLAKGRLWQHELRDSYKILPVPLSAYEKDTINYEWFEADQREQHKAQISDYLRADCVYLHELVSAFRAEHGDVLTIGGAAMRAIRKTYDLPKLRPDQDALYRPFFHGGRCEAFQIGKLRGRWKMYDVNSMYPFVMARREHPIGAHAYETRTLPEKGFYLADITARSRGAFPSVVSEGPDKGTLTFPHGTVRVQCTSHEIRTALREGLADVLEVHRVYAWEHTSNFGGFILEHAARKEAADKCGDKATRLLEKLLMNNGYGKFAQNPDRFKEHDLFNDLDELTGRGYELAGFMGSRYVGARMAHEARRATGFHNVATGASITGAARAELMTALARARNAIYCDTDSVICEELPLPTDDRRLGAWKIEAEPDTLFIAAKKLYAARQGRAWVKWASKGAPLEPETIARIAQGEVHRAFMDAPCLRLGSPARFLDRTLARKDRIT